MFVDRLHAPRASSLLRKMNLQNNRGRAVGGPGVAVEALEQRQVLALLGVTLTQLPLEFYDVSGQLNFEASTGKLDIAATPTAILLPGGPPKPFVGAQHGDFQIHARISPSGALIGGINPGDTVNLGTNPSGDDFVIRGAADLDGNGSIDPMTESGIMLRGEIYGFGFFDSGGPTDQYDYKFVVTGGLLASHFAGKDAGVVMTSENSTFANDFTQDFVGGAKGTAGPINPPAPASIGGNVYYDADNDGIFDGTESGIPGTTVTLTGVNDVGQPVNLVTMTNGAGAYLFSNLRPGTYTITETQPIGYLDGKDTIGTPGGMTTNDQFSGIVLPAGFNGVDNNFGELLPAGISGNVYYDEDNDGNFDNTEFGISGVTVTLTGTDDLGNPVNLVTMTNGLGFYSFGNLRPGTYQLDESQPGGYLDGKDTIGTPGGTTSNDQFSNINLPAGFDGVENNFGELLAASIAGNVYYDADNDGIFDGIESGIGGVTVTLTGTDDLGNPVNIVTATNAAGAYSFTGLRPGTYQIDESQPGGYLDGKDTIGTPGGSTSNDQFTNIVLNAGVNGTDNNFGELLASSLSGYVYVDTDDDGNFDGVESPIGGVTVTLTGTDDLGNPVNTVTVTNALGFYIFSGLRPGTYVLTETQPAGYNDGKDTIGTPGGNTANDQFSNINLPAGFDGVNNNYGERLVPVLGSISGTKYLDITGNGKSADDQGFGGVKIYIDADNDGVFDAGELNTTTAANGSWSFSGLSPGTYIVREVVPSGYVRTHPTLSDKYTVNLGAGQNVTGIDFANAEKCDMTVLSSYYFIINGTTVVNSLNGNTNQGDEVTVVFTVAPNRVHEFTLVSYTAPDPFFDPNTASQQEIFDVDTGTFGPGTHTLTVRIPDCYYQIDFVCGAAIDQLGPAGSNIFYTPQTRLFSADNDGENPCVDDHSSISGVVYLDKDNDGVKDSNEHGISGVYVTLTGTDENGQSVSITKKTFGNGTYYFGNLRAGTYKVTETQPTFFADGKDTLGSLGGTKPANDQLASIVLGDHVDAVNYNFGELPCSGNNISTGQSANIAFWRGKGMNLIKSLWGSSNSTKLGNWLATTLPNLFGSAAGSAYNLTGKTNTLVAQAFATRFASAEKMEAQIMATALNVYVSSSSLSGGNYGTAYGFAVTSGGLGSKTVNVVSAGTALGVSNNSTMTVLTLLSKANSKASAGFLYSGNSSYRSACRGLFDSTNQCGCFHQPDTSEEGLH